MKPESRSARTVSSVIGSPLPRGRKSWAILRLAVLPVIVATAVLVAWKLGYFELEHRQDLVRAVDQIRRSPWAEGTYVLACTIAIVLCLPAVIATFVAGAVFGVWKGALLAWIGALTATVAAHFLARSVARRPARRLFGDHRLFRELKEHDSVPTLLRLRLLPVAPFAVLDYVGGIANISLPRLLAATMIAVLPSVIAYSYAGAELMRGLLSTSGASHEAIWIAAVVTVAMMALSAVPTLVRKFRG